MKPSCHFVSPHIRTLSLCCSSFPFLFCYSLSPVSPVVQPGSSLFLTVERLHVTTCQLITVPDRSALGCFSVSTQMQRPWYLSKRSRQKPATRDIPETLPSVRDMHFRLWISANLIKSHGGILQMGHFDENAFSSMFNTLISFSAQLKTDAPHPSKNNMVTQSTIHVV